jgi:diadenosine tetraphosphate (Ap4A) HIT family hydrolase
MGFELHPNLKIKSFVVDLPLCRVLLEDEATCPWIFLVPRRSNISRISDLQKEDQLLLLEELDVSQKILLDLFHPTQLNVAAIGNKTPQLHIHVIARYSTDPAWPNTIWDHPVRARYLPERKQEVIQFLHESFESAQLKG